MTTVLFRRRGLLAAIALGSSQWRVNAQERVRRVGVLNGVIQHDDGEAEQLDANRRAQDGVHVMISSQRSSELVLATHATASKPAPADIARKVPSRSKLSHAPRTSRAVRYSPCSRISLSFNTRNVSDGKSGP